MSRTKNAFVAALSFCAVPFSAQADDAGAALIGGIFGGLVGGMIGSSQGKQAPAAPRTVVVSERVINIQKALAFFGFFKGSVDGISGSGTRRAIRDYLKAVNLPAGDDLNDDQYAALMKVYAEKTSVAGGQSVTPNQPSQPAPSNSGPSDTINAVYKAIESPSPQLASSPDVGLGDKLGGSAARVQLRDVCLLSMPVRAPTDSDTIFAIKKHLCTNLGAAAMQANAAMAAPDFGDGQAFLDRCSQLSEAVNSVVPNQEAPSTAFTRIQEQFAGAPKDQTDEVRKTLRQCFGFHVTTGKAQAARAMALALGALGERQNLEFIGAQAVLGIEVDPNPGLAADWYEAAAASGGTLADLTLKKDDAKPSDAMIFRGFAKELRNISLNAKISGATVKASAPLSNTPNAAPDVSNGMPMNRPNLADIIRDSIVIILNTDAGASGTGFFI